MRKWLFFLLALFFLAGCQPQPKTQTAYYFDTLVTITLPYNADTALFDRAWKLCSEYELRFDRFSADSDLGHLLPNTPTAVDEETAVLIQTALDLSDATDGAFDIRLGAVSDLWNQDTLPDADTIAKVLKEAHATTVTANQHLITVDGLGKPDLGGIAKGYVTDRLAELFRNEGVDYAILNLGGNVYCLGDKKGEPFSVGIDTLMDQPDPPVLKITNQAAVTAGVTQRYKTVDGVRIHHILDPQTGAPTKTGLLSATVIADSATVADVLSTACIVLGQEKAEELLNKFPGVSAVLVTEDGSVIRLFDPPFVETAQN